MRELFNQILDVQNFNHEGAEYLTKWGVTAFLSLSFAAMPVLLLWFGTHLI